MSLTLSSADAARFQAASECLLGPLEHDSISGWQREVTTRLASLFRADRTIFTLPVDDGSLQQVCWGVDPAMERQLAAVLAGTRPGDIEFRDHTLDTAFHRAAVAGIRVWNVPILEHLSGVTLSASPFWQEVVVPARVADNVMIAVSLPIGGALLGIAYDRPGGEHFGDETLELARLLLPSVRAGLMCLIGLGARRQALETMIDTLPIGVRVTDAAGAELHRNPAFGRLLDAEPECALLLAAADALARRALELRTGARRTDGRPTPPGEGCERIRTATGCYALGVGYLPPATFARSRALLTTITRTSVAPPRAFELRTRLPLTRRESEVAALLALGASDATVGRTLGISAHTASKHAEHIFDKLGIHSRKAFALELERRTREEW